jgi:hypothetical protein
MFSKSYSRVEFPKKFDCLLEFCNLLLRGINRIRTMSWIIASETFQLAAIRAVASCANVGWDRLTAREQCSAIYHELRNLDMESLRQATSERLPITGAN